MLDLASPFSLTRPVRFPLGQDNQGHGRRSKQFCPSCAVGTEVSELLVRRRLASRCQSQSADKNAECVQFWRHFGIAFQRSNGQLQSTSQAAATMPITIDSLGDNGTRLGTD